MANLEPFLRFVDRAVDRMGVSQAPLVADILADTALRRWGRRGFTDDSFMAALHCLVECYQREANLNVFGRISAKWDTLRCFANLIRFDIEEERAPHVRKIEIRRPIFITGLPRSGTSFLHTLFSCDPAIQMPRCWQLIFPYPLQSARRDTRRSRVEKQLRFFQQLAPELVTLHPMSADSPQECTEITAQVFQSLRYEMTHHIPSYQSWIDRSGHLNAYRFHKRFLQHLQHQQAGHRDRPSQWILKCPDHIHALDAIETVYPDARFVFVHRDPVRVIPSAAKLTEVVRRPFTRRTDPRAIGTQVVERALEAANVMMARSSLDESGRIVHLHYTDLADRPLDTIESLYSQFALELDHNAREGMRKLIASSHNGSGGHNIDMFGLNPGALCAQFAAYVDHFGVRREAAAWRPLRHATAPVAA